MYIEEQNEGAAAKETRMPYKYIHKEKEKMSGKEGCSD